MSAATAPVLVVDDSVLSCCLLEHMLQLDGREAASVGSIAQAELAIAECPPSLIVLDIRLPDGDGLDLAFRLKADRATAGVPIIVASAGIVSGERERALATGCEAYVGKPIDIAAFARMVDTLLGPPRRGAPGEPPL